MGPITLFTIDLSRQDYDEFYRGFANGTLWPALHYQIGLGRFEWPEFAGYRRVNETFARALVPLLRDDDLIWAHDYHLLCLAQACLVTPLRDGMNLVAKEYIAAQNPNDPGVLILSEFAGAARELDATLLVNPYDEAGMAGAMDRALAMSLAERCERHQAMLAMMRVNSLERGRDHFEADLRGR